MDAIRYFVNTDDFGTAFGYPTQLFVAVALVVAAYAVLLLLLVVHAVKSNKPKKITLLMGAQGAGKTALFRQLREGAFVETAPSTEEFGAKFPMHETFNTLKAKAFITVFDFPGHERLRKRIANYFPRTGTVVFLVDAANAAANRKAAEYLFEVFSNVSFVDAAPKMLIACNKTDLDESEVATVDAVREALEVELTRVKATRKPAAGGARVGRDDVAFEFGVDAPCPVTFTACSVKNGELDDVATFILSNQD